MRHYFLALTITAASFAGEPANKSAKPPADNPPIGNGKLILEEDFESTAAGQVPKNFTKQGAVAVVDDIALSKERIGPTKSAAKK